MVVHLLLNWGDPIELGTVVTSSTTPDAATPLTYVLPTGLRLNGWNVGGEDTQGSAQWPADKQTVTYNELVETFYDAQTVAENGVCDIYALADYEADASNPVTLY